MEELIYRRLQIDECDKISHINPKQYIKNAWRTINGNRQLVEIDYMENDWPDGYERYRNELEEILGNNGAAWGAFDSNDLLHGFVSLNKKSFGKTAKYMLLDSMFVNLEDRGRGIGKRLFDLCCEEARNSKADKLYICAGSAEDTVAFYKSCGCIEAVEINNELYEQDKRDLQLEFNLK